MSEGSYLSIISDIRGAGFPVEEKIGGFDEFMEEFAGAFDKPYNGGEEKEVDVDILNLEIDGIEDNGIISMDEDEQNNDTGIIPVVEEEIEKPTESGIVSIHQEDNINPDDDNTKSILGSNEEKVLNEIDNLASKLLQ